MLEGLRGYEDPHFRKERAVDCRWKEPLLYHKSHENNINKRKKLSIYKWKGWGN